MTYTALAHIVCFDKYGSEREVGLMIRWTGADGFDNRMLNLQRCQKVITALGNKIECPVARISSVNYSMQDCKTCRPDVTLGISGL
jgi:hypothetical protein